MLRDRPRKLLLSGTVAASGWDSRDRVCVVDVRGRVRVPCMALYASWLSLPTIVHVVKGGDQVKENEAVALGSAE